MDVSVRRETFGQADYGWLGSAHGTDQARSITIDVSALTEGTHYPNGYIPSGTPLSELTATGLYAPYDDDVDPDDGTETLAGFLLEPVKVSGTADVAGALLEHGRIIPANLPIAIDAAGVADIAGRITTIGGLA